MSPSTGDPELASDLGLIVVAYHRPEGLARLLDSAAGQAARILVVNVEEDPAVAAVARRRGVIVLGLDSNPGYAAAVNAGAAALSTPLVAFANDDLELAPGCLAALAAELEAGADVAVPRLCRPDGGTEPSVSRLLSPAALAGEWVALPDQPPAFLPSRLLAYLPVQKWRRPGSSVPIRAAEAALVATHADVLSRFPLPEAYFLYWEEHEWFHRLSRHGRSVLYVPAAVATHAGWDELSPAKAKLLARNAVRCLVRTKGRAAAVAGFPLVLAWWARLWALDALRAALRPSPVARSRLASRSAGVGAALFAWREIAEPASDCAPDRPVTLRQSSALCHGVRQVAGAPGPRPDL